jgi:hypothetical protein
MHSHLSVVFARFDDAHATVKAAADLLPEGLWSRRPGENRWSVNEVLEHLSIVETRFAKAIGEAVAAARAAGLGPENRERTPLSAQTATMLVDRTVPRIAPEPARPTGALDAEDAWAAVECSRETVRNALTCADGLALSEVTYSHPFFGSLTAYQWVEFLAGHRLRHAEQIREVARQVAGT